MHENRWIILQTVRLACVYLAVGCATISYAQVSPEVGAFDTGKMWTFDHPPVEYFQDTYGVEASSDWFEHARLGTLRIPGCTASFVSSYGLMLTNHHCSRNAVTNVTNSGEELFDNGFYATSLDAERQVPGMYADQLIEINDVTAEVFAALDSVETDAEKAAARTQVEEQIKNRLAEASGFEEDDVVVEVIPLYHGGLYSAYTFRRFSDVRLVMIPEAAVGFFGGDTDNFTFPRYTLDMALFRVYEGGVPYEPDHFFLWSLEGAQTGEPVFVVGNPGSTSRLETTAQLRYRRDVSDKNLLAFIESRLERLQDVYEQPVPAPEKAVLRNLMFSLKNGRKAYSGQLKALNNAVIMERRQAAENQFVQAISAKSSLDSAYGNVIDDMTAIQEEFHELASAHGAFFALTSAAYSSAVLRRAMLAYELQSSAASGVSEETLEAIRERIANVPDQSEILAEALLAARLKDMHLYLGSEHEMVMRALQGKDPDARAREIIERSLLTTQASAVDALGTGSLDEEDAAITLVRAFYQAYQDYRSASAGLSAKQANVAEAIGRARYEVYDTSIPPDATFSLRIADGIVQGYAYNGTIASPFTSYYGMYDHYYSYGAGSEWDLPERWLEPLESFDRSVPLNFASTNDIIGGNSGSPVLNKDLELVGLIFDGNIESLAGNYIYLPELYRAVSVDARGILEALDEVYGADRVVYELKENELISSEGE